MKCTFIKPDGSSCKANALISSAHCWYHSKKSTDRKKQASSKGGANSHSLANRLPLELPPIIINSPADIPPLLVDTIGQLRQSNIHVRVAATIGYLSHILLKSYEVADLERRVKTLEEKLPLTEYKLLVPTEKFEELCETEEFCKEE